MKYVTLPYDPAWQALAWAKKNCPSYITNAVHDDVFVFSGMSGPGVTDTKIDYFFSDEKDMLVFILRWGGK
jgi:hypothetical protein